jgi:hypothetical protein
MFIKVNMLRTHSAFGGWVPEDIASVLHVAEQEAAPRNELILVASILWYVRIGKAAEWAQITDVRFTTIESLKGGAASEGRGWEHVLDVGRIENCPAPE